MVYSWHVEGHAQAPWHLGPRSYDPSPCPLHSSVGAGGLGGAQPERLLMKRGLVSTAGRVCIWFPKTSAQQAGAQGVLDTLHWLISFTGQRKPCCLNWAERGRQCKSRPAFPPAPDPPPPHQRVAALNTFSRSFSTVLMHLQAYILPTWNHARLFCSPLFSSRFNNMSWRSRSVCIYKPFSFWLTIA